MFANFKQNFVRARRVVNKKPVIAVLIVDGEFVTAKVEIEPNFRYPICDKPGHVRAVQSGSVIAQNVKKNCFGQIREIARAVVHSEIKEFDRHRLS